MDTFKWFQININPVCFHAIFRLHEDDDEYGIISILYLVDSSFQNDFMPDRH